MATKRVVKKKLGYMPARLPQHKSHNPLRHWHKVYGKEPITIYPRPEVDEWTDTPIYPKINDGSVAGLKRKVRTDWYDSLKKLPTMDAKMLEISTKYKHHAMVFAGGTNTYNSLPFTQYLTRTACFRNLPDSYSIKSTTNHEEESKEESHLLEHVKSTLLNQIALSAFETKQKLGVRNTVPCDESEYQRSHQVQQLFSSSQKVIFESALNTAQIDLNPKIHSWWWHSGFKPATPSIFYKSRIDINGNVNQLVQYSGDASICYRGEALIEPIVSPHDEKVTNQDLVAPYRYPMVQFGAEKKEWTPVMIPGYWAEKTPRFDFPHTAVLTTGSLYNRQSQLQATILGDTENYLESQAILFAFSWLNGLAAHHGYTPYQELDYPLTTQIITTNGQDWLFNVYQMNSHTFHRDVDQVPKNNFFWTSGLMKLYDNYADGTFSNVNDDVIKLLMKFVTKKASESYTAQQTLRPFLGVDQRDQQTTYLERKKLKNWFANKYYPCTETLQRVALWEKIFFIWPESRGLNIKEMKQPFHVRKPKMPREFE